MKILEEAGCDNLCQLLLVIGYEVIRIGTIPIRSISAPRRGRKLLESIFARI